MIHPSAHCILFPDEQPIHERTEEERRDLAEKYEAHGYEWESCVLCGKSDKESFVKTGWAMLIWHVDIGALCEFCYGDYPDELEELNEDHHQDRPEEHPGK